MRLSGVLNSDREQLCGLRSIFLSQPLANQLFCSFEICLSDVFSRYLAKTVALILSHRRITVSYYIAPHSYKELQEKDKGFQVQVRITCDLYK